MDEPENNESGKSLNIAGIVDWLWKFLSSTKLALALILIVVGMSLLGVFLTNINFFHSWIFLTAGALLMTNVLVCSINRWPGIRHSLQGGEIKQKEGFFTGSEHSEIGAIPMPPVKTSEVAEKVLRTHGYRVRVIKEADAVYMAADKNRYFRLGTYISHLSLVLFVLAYMLGGYLGFHETDFAVSEGSTREVGHNTGLSLQLISFVDEYYPDNMPKDYRSQVVLYENGQEIKQALIRVNHPLVYKGIRFYQSSFGQALKMQITMAGEEVFHGTVPMDNTLQIQGVTRYFGLIELENGDIVRFIGSGGAGDQMIPEGQLAIIIQTGEDQVGPGLIEKDIALSLGGLDFLYQGDSKFSGFQVSNDPANLLIWISSALFILGISLVFYFPYRQAWVLSKSVNPENSRILLRAGASRGPGSASELKELVNEIEKGLPEKKSARIKEAK